MELEKWIGDITIKAKEMDLCVFLIENENSIEETLPIVRLENNSRDIEKLLNLLTIHKLPLITYQKCYRTDEIELISLDDYDVNVYSEYLGNEKMQSYVNGIIEEHNNKLKSIPLNVVVKAQVIAIISSAIYMIECNHAVYVKVKDELHLDIIDILEDLEHDSYYSKLKSEFEKVCEEETRKEAEKAELDLQELLKEWSAFLSANEKFKFCSNEKLRQAFFKSNFEKFIMNYTNENNLMDLNKIVARQRMFTEMELTWKRIKEEKK